MLSETARLTLSKAGVAQIVSITLLAPHIQTAILEMHGRRLHRREFRDETAIVVSRTRLTREAKAFPAPGRAPTGILTATEIDGLKGTTSRQCANDTCATAGPSEITSPEAPLLTFDTYFFGAGGFCGGGAGGFCGGGAGGFRGGGGGGLRCLKGSPFVM